MILIFAFVCASVNLMLGIVNNNSLGKINMFVSGAMFAFLAFITK